MHLQGRREPWSTNGMTLAIVRVSIRWLRPSEVLHMADHPDDIRFVTECLLRHKEDALLLRRPRFYSESMRAFRCPPSMTM